MIRRLIDLGELPFHTGATPTPANGVLPDTLPFALGVDDGAGRVVQMPCADVSRALARAYADGSMIGTPLSADGMGRRYADDFCAFLGSCDFHARRVLEIGCGTGYLLDHLTRSGAECVGIDPGPAPQGATRIRDTFPSPLVSGAFDAIVHYCVLEHVEDPAWFLRAQVDRLTPGGRILLAVPDVEPYLAGGDVSIFVHQHWSYFTVQSLTRLLHSAGLQIARLERSHVGGLLYVEAILATAIDPGPASVVTAAEPSFVPGLPARIRRHLASSRALFNGPGQYGLFPAGRALNLVHLLRLPDCPRLFDDDPRLHGRYLPPLPRAIESRDDLRARPVDTLVITSRAFGAALGGELATDPALQATRFVLQ